MLRWWWWWRWRWRWWWLWWWWRRCWVDGWEDVLRTDWYAHAVRCMTQKIVLCVNKWLSVRVWVSNCVSEWVSECVCVYVCGVPVTRTRVRPRRQVREMFSAVNSANKRKYVSHHVCPILHFSSMQKSTIQLRPYHGHTKQTTKITLHVYPMLSTEARPSLLPPKD